MHKLRKEAASGYSQILYFMPDNTLAPIYLQCHEMWNGGPDVYYDDKTNSIWIVAGAGQVQQAKNYLARTGSYRLSYGSFTFGNPKERLVGPKVSDRTRKTWRKKHEAHEAFVYFSNGSIPPQMLIKHIHGCKRGRVLLMENNEMECVKCDAVVPVSLRAIVMMNGMGDTNGFTNS